MLVNAILLIDGKPKQIEVTISSSEKLPFTVKQTLVFETFTYNKPFDGQDNVYLIRNDETQRYKIGFSNDTKKRLRTFSTGNDCSLTLMACCLGGKETETYFHKKYEKNWHKGEWFIFNDQEIVDIIEEFSQKRNLEDLLRKGIESIDKEASEKKRQLEIKFGLRNTPKKITLLSEIPTKEEMALLTMAKLKDIKVVNGLNIKGYTTMNKVEFASVLHETLLLSVGK